jgi:hypothetical protein
MTVVAEHALRDMARDVHNGLIASTAFRKVRDKGVPVIVPPSRHLGVSADILPGRLECGNGPRRIAGAGPSKRKDIPLRASLAKLLSVPNCVFPQDREQ